jgi:hypothetical protein
LLGLLELLELLDEELVEDDGAPSLVVLDDVDESLSEEDEDVGVVEAAGRLADEVDERESVMYQPLPLKTIPTGWMILRRVPPHCSHVVSGGSEKLWRFSMTSLQAVQV